MKKYIKGIYKRSIYKTDQGYIIGLFKVKETNSEALEDYINKTLTFTGNFHELNEDDEYIFYGEEIDHPRYGFQFQVSEYERIMPTDRDGIIAFLSSDLFNGIGEKLAKSIVDTLGENTLDLILNDKENLKKVPKITQKKIDIIFETLGKYESSNKTIIYLTDIGFNMQEALRIYNKYKENTILQIEHNIYKLIDDVDEITFLKIDQIGKKLNIDETNEQRIRACILYIMNSLIYSNGDTYLTYQEITDEVIKYLNLMITTEEFEDYFVVLKNEDKIVIQERRYYLKDIYEAENNVTNKIRILNNLSKTDYKNLDLCINKLEETNNIKYDEIQRKAIKSALEKNILIITGGPGTGKTTIIKAIVELYIELNNLKNNEILTDISLLAPTGRASKRLSESTNLPASTIHRFLGWNKETNKFKIDEYNKDSSKLIIIDEVSMIDISLLNSLFQGLKDDIKLILVGDYNQLPSVGPGQVLRDLIESDIIDTIHLNLLYRQNENSYIPYLANEIKEDNLSENFLDTREDYTFLECNTHFIKQTIIDLCTKVKEKGYDYKRVQLMAPMYSGENGIDILNKELQNVFNPYEENKRELKYGDVIFRENDKILQLVNMPDDNVFNGDIGVIKYIIYYNTSKSGKNEIYVDYDGNLVKYVPKAFNKIKHGFITSIHKSQGSEFEMVIVPVCFGYRRMLYRKLIYTAVTRAKRKLIIVGEPLAFIQSIKNDNEFLRKTYLKEKLIFMNNVNK